LIEEPEQPDQAPEDDAAAEEPAQEAAAEETPEAPTEETPAEETPEDAPAEETLEEAPAAARDAPDEPIPPAAEPEPEPQIQDPQALEPDTPEEVAEERQAEDAAAIQEAAEEERRPRGKAAERGERDLKTPPADVIPGEHLTPDIALTPDGPESDIEQLLAEQPAAPVDYAPDEAPDFQPDPDEAQPQTVARTPVQLAAEARYRATGKRKTSVARVILRPGKGEYTINGRSLEVYFPRATLQHTARQPLETAGYQESMDVVAKIHGGGVSAQADALRHGIARALIEVDPQLRTDLKRQGFLTRDARAKERKKAGLKKARKRPQFSKR
jgi:small subunit ribosomal protein S9